MDPGSSAPGRPHPRSPADRFACTHPLPPQTDTPDPRPGPRGPAPARPRRELRRSPAQLGFAPDLSCGRWKRRVSPCCPASTSPWAHSPAFLGWSSAPGSARVDWAHAATPLTLPVAQCSRPCLLGTAHGGGSGLGLDEPAQPQGAQCPQPAFSSVAPQRAQSMDHPAPSSALGEPIHLALPAPSS